MPDKLAFDFKVTTDLGTKRIARAAFDYAKANGKTSVSIVTKANIMKKRTENFPPYAMRLPPNMKVSPLRTGI